ncbi:MAG: hypothetical protein R3C25_10005 [Hyphomonadaceae bacterium]
MQDENTDGVVINRVRAAAAIAKAEAAKRCVGEVVVRFAFGLEAEAVRLDWSRQDGMGNRSGRITTPWDEIASEPDPLIAGLRQAIVAVSASAN